MNRFASVTRPLMWFMAFMLAALTAGCGGGSGGGAPILGLPSVVSLTVTPATATVPITGFQQYTATAVYSDGLSSNVTATSTWTKVETPTVPLTVVATLTNSVGGIGGGLATGTAAGTATITAAFGGRTATATLNVNKATFVSLVVWPTTATIPVSGTQQFTLIETFSDGSSYDRTPLTVAAATAGTTLWSTSDITKATVGTTTVPATGLATDFGLATGVAVTPVATPVIIGASFTPLGGALIPATSATLTVNAAISTKFEVVPSGVPPNPLVSIRVGDTQHYSAIETFSNGQTVDRTAASIWSTGGDLHAVFGDPICLATGCATGKILTPAGSPVIITASYVGTVSYTGAFGLAARTANLTVNDKTSTKFVVTPATASTAIGGNQPFKATETFSDGTTSDRTAASVWSAVDLVPVVPANVPVASITNGVGGGVTTGLNAGTSTITATYGTYIGIVGLADRTAILTVSTAPLPPVPPAFVVNLRSAATFGIAATAGVTNTGLAPNTNIHGDVVLDPTATCNAVAAPGGVGTLGFGACGGFAPTLTGTVVTPASLPAGTSTGVKTDLLAAFLSITPTAGPPAAGSLPGGTPIAAPTTLGALTGSALVLGQNYFTPGVYTSITSILITNDLTLDALGDPNAVFVFQSASTLGTAAGAAPPGGVRTRILLIGGAKASNVWWQVGTSATLKLFSEFQGNILSSASITMEIGATSCGRLLAGAFTAGAFVFDSNVVSVPGLPFAPPATYSAICL